MLLLFRENQSKYFSIYRRVAAWPLIQTPSNKQTWTLTHTHKNISDIDILCFPILVTYHVCAVGAISWMPMRVCEPSWHPWHLQGQNLNPHSLQSVCFHQAFSWMWIHDMSNYLFLSLKQVTFKSMISNKHTFNSLRWHSVQLIFSLEHLVEDTFIPCRI